MGPRPLYTHIKKAEPPLRLRYVWKARSSFKNGLSFETGQEGEAVTIVICGGHVRLNTIISTICIASRKQDCQDIYFAKKHGSQDVINRW